MDKRNPEGYMDLTAYEALMNLDREKKKPLVFICSPFSGNVKENIERAKRYGRFAVSQEVIPVIPHLMYPQFLSDHDPEERMLGIEMGLELLTRCNRLWVFGDYISQGMAVEICKAKKMHIPIQYFTISCSVTGGIKR
ncbi:MAG: DUF4406 domain-containing protein [Bacillota bacterium]|nr:DUF4406 domain-containing protein [Bacillota bacterium]MDW7677838.1 DUF4406 domain-containing protein [Bacillota bacterium]